MIRCFMIEERGSWEEHNQHWVNLDTDEVYGARPVGAMWWADVTERHRPTGPADYAPDVDLDWLRANKDGLVHGAMWPGDNPQDPTLPAAHPSYTFADGLHLCVQTPGGMWNIDSRASNCTMPYDLAHRCWVRHGEPPNITVDKNGLTCSAGGGSIMCGSYHGFLQNGALT